MADKKKKISYRIRYQKKVTIGDTTEEILIVKNEDMLNLITILVNNSYEINSVKKI